MSADELTAAVRRLYGHVAHWTPPRWAASAVSAAPGPAASAVSAAPGPAASAVSAAPGPASSSSGPTRADLIHGLVQRIADLAADVEGQPRRPVPRLDNDLALGDQLRVVAADLVAADPPPAVLADTAALITTTHHSL